MSVHVSSAGVRVIRTGGTAVAVHVMETRANGLDISPAEDEALRGFYQAEADESLGRWRWPENPDYVVYAGTSSIRVMSESTGLTLNAERDQYSSSLHEQTLYGAASAYFDAHPEPKPWHDANPGDVWRFETPDDRRHALGWVARDGSWDLMTPRGENVREVADPMAWLAENWGDEFEGAKATRFVPEVSW